MTADKVSQYIRFHSLEIHHFELLGVLTRKTSYNRLKDYAGPVSHSPEKGVVAKMTTFEAIYLMIAFATLVVMMQKK